MMVRQLRDDRIAYVAIDDGLRTTTFVGQLSEDIYQEHFELAFEAADHGNLVIYKVPTVEP